MIKLSLKFDMSMGKILLGFAGISLVVCAYKLYSTKEKEESPNSDNDDIILTESDQNLCFESKDTDDLVSTLRIKKKVSSDKDSNKDRHELKSSPKKVANKSSIKHSESVNLSLQNLNEVSSNNPALVKNDNNALNDDYLVKVFDKFFTTDEISSFWNTTLRK